MALQAPHLLHFLRSQPLTSPSSSSSSSSSSCLVSFLKPFILSTPNALSAGFPQLNSSPLSKPFFSPFTHHPTQPFRSPFSSYSSSISVPHSPPPAAAIRDSAESSEAEEEEGQYYSDEDDETELYGEETDASDDELESEREDFEGAQMGLESDSTSSPLEKKREERLKLEVPSLSVKERKELASYAHSLGKKLKSQLVGKSGVTSNVATSFIETLEANELLKIKIHRSCPGELEDVVKQLEEATGSVVVGKIGRTLIIYRPSLTKMKAEEKKRQVRQVFLKRQQKYRQKRELAYKSSQRGSTWKGSSSSWS